MMVHIVPYLRYCARSDSHRYQFSYPEKRSRGYIQYDKKHRFVATIAFINLSES